MIIMYEIAGRAATNRETKILKLRLENLEKPYILSYTAAAALACVSVVALPRVLGIGTLQAVLISLMIFLICVYKIFEEKSEGEPLKKNIAKDLLYARIQEITVKKAVLSGSLDLNNASFFCFEISWNKLLIVSRNVINHHFTKHLIFDSLNDSDGGNSSTAGEKDVSLKSLNFPSDEFTIAIAPESGVILSIKTSANKIECSQSSNFCGAECHRDCEIIDATTDYFLKMPDEKYFSKAYESVNINKKSVIFNELAGIFAGGLIFYGLGYDATYGAALGWAASHTMTLFMVLLFDGPGIYDYYVNYLICELKPWQYQSESEHSRKLRSAFIIINTIILFGLIYISEPGLSYLAILAISFAMSIVLVFIPLLHISSAQTFMIELACLLTLYLIGFREAAVQGFMIICLIMLLIGLADKQHKIGMAFLKLFFGAGTQDENNSSISSALRKTPIVNSYKLYLKYIFSLLTAFLIITVFLPALPDLLYSHSSGGFSASPIVEPAGKIIEAKSCGIKFVFIPAGSFMMGSADTDSSNSDERPVHKVTISKGFYLSATEITQKQWLAAMGLPAPCKFKGDDLPVESVSWNDCMDFVNKMNETEKKEIYRLPTEAEWEYACRAKSTQKYCCGDDAAMAGEYAWHFDNSNNSTHPAGSKKPNAWGLYDMHANVWEWCMDNYAKYMPFDLIDPRGPVLNSSPDDKKVIRGGGWYNPSNGCTSSNRDAAAQGRRSSDIGMRLLKIDDSGINK